MKIYLMSNVLPDEQPEWVDEFIDKEDFYSTWCGSESLDVCGKRIMLVEDEREIRDDFAGYLRCAGADVYPFDNPIKALDDYESVMPEIVITDFMIPNINGIEFASLLRGKEKKNNG